MLCVYCESKGIANMCNVEWKTILYVILDKINSKVLALRQYLHPTDFYVTPNSLKTGQVASIIIIMLEKNYINW
jgi:hypothetical protein